MKKYLLFLVLLPFNSFSQHYYTDSVFIRQIASNILNHKDADSNLFHLTKNVGHRLSGSPQMVQAQNWGRQAMQAAGADKVIMQQLLVPHWVRGEGDAAAVIYNNSAGKQITWFLHALALGNAIGSGVEMLADVKRVNDFDELDKKQEQVNNKIVFFNVPFEDSLISPFQAYGKNVKYRVNGASMAAKYGAKGILLRSMTNGAGNEPHTGTLLYNDSFPKIPAMAIGLADVMSLNELFDSGVALRASMHTHGKMLPDTIAYNVIGELKGSEFPNEFITVGGHLDSWDVGEGAHDDGAGVVQTIEILRVFKNLNYSPRHTIRFVLFANEENGTRGGLKYSEEAVARNEIHLFALESDAGGFTPRGFGFDVPDSSWAKLESWNSLFEPYMGNSFKRGGGGADIGPLKKALNVPVAGMMPDNQRYFDFHHAATDVFENVNMRELKLGAVNMAALIYLVDKYGL